MSDITPLDIPPLATAEVKTLPVREELNAVYRKGNRGGTVPVSYTVYAQLFDGITEKISLARRRHRDTTPAFEPTLMTVEVDELDGLIELLTLARDEMSSRGLETRYKR